MQSPTAKEWMLLGYFYRRGGEYAGKVQNCKLIKLAQMRKYFISIAKYNGLDIIGMSYLMIFIIVIMLFNLYL